MRAAYDEQLLVLCIVKQVLISSWLSIQIEKLPLHIYANLRITTVLITGEAINEQFQIKLNVMGLQGQKIAHQQKAHVKFQSSTCRKNQQPRLLFEKFCTWNRSYRKWTWVIFNLQDVKRSSADGRYRYRYTLAVARIASSTLHAKLFCVPCHATISQRLEGSFALLT